MWPIKKKSIEKNNDLAESFTVLSGQFNGFPFIASINTGAEKYKNKKGYPWFLGISIPIKNPDQNGFPSKNELELIYVLEENIKSLIKKNVSGQFIGWSNWNSHREVIHYISEPEAVVKSLEIFLKNNPNIKFAYRAEHDGDWKKIDVYLARR